MKTYILSILLIVTTASFLSCSDNSELTKEIEKLQIENRKLKSNLQRNNYNKIVLSQLMLIPNSLSFQINKPNSISGIFFEQQNFPEYDIYFADENYKFNESDKITLKNGNGNQFEFDYIPKTLEDKTVRIVAVFNLDTVKVNLNGRIDLPVK